MSSDRTYFSRRVQQESTAAEAASCPKARQVHRDLAKLYSARLDLPEAEGAAAAAGTARSLAR